MLTTDDIRDLFLHYFKGKGHSLIASDSLIPQNDPTLLFTGAGMNQFKDYFLGLKKDLKRAASSQKCLRTGDLDQVGKTPYHHSFFEMLGNFSFGDYFKEEAILWAWEFLTEKLRIPKERLRVSVHESDEEAYGIWRDRIKIREDWIYKLGDDTNFWPANAPKDGPNGPCGPCSEIYFDQGEDPNNPHPCSIEHDCGRFAEIWNLVFTQFDRQDGGKLAPLASKNIDTGMGLERLACVLQGKKTNFEIDIFQPVIEAVAKALGVPVEEVSKATFYTIADHLRAVVFAIHDGVIPSNEGRGYVVRKLIRRSLWHASQLMPNMVLENSFLHKIVPNVAMVMGKAYPELKEAERSIAGTLQGEEEKFISTLEIGIKMLSLRLSNMSTLGKNVLPGDIVFELYDTYGFPDELTRIISEKQGFSIDQEGFDRLMEKQRRQAKAASQISGAIFASTDLEKKIAGLPATQFLGYQAFEAEGSVLMAELENKKGVVVLDQTPFYAESGGQVGDQGILEGPCFKADILDTQKKDQVFLHMLEVREGSIHAGDKVKAKVDKGRRDRIMRNHTATHLLHAALRKILGSQVRQLGSLVSPDKLRFDYSYSQPLAADQIRLIEESVNSEILKDTALSKEEKPIEEAKQEGAIAFFGEKYGEKVRVVTVPGYSKEFCGGTHCDRTGQIGVFLIVSDSSIASGTRRIEAITGEGALEYTRSLRLQMTQLVQDLKTTPQQLGERVAKLQESVKKMEKDKGRQAGGTFDPQKIIDQAVAVDSLRFAAFYEKGIPPNDLRFLSDSLRSRGRQLIYLLATETEEKIHFLLGMSHELVKSDLDLRRLMEELTPLLGSSGGGRKDFVQGGGPNRGQFQSHWQEITEKASGYLKQVGH
ncbi:MAG TPA: alanine--tRNA ligase [bacterium]|nr:alanine--tRNA ligase [bacterium]